MLVTTGAHGRGARSPGAGYARWCRGREPLETSRGAAAPIRAIIGPRAAPTNRGPGVGRCAHRVQDHDLDAAESNTDQTRAAPGIPGWPPAGGSELTRSDSSLRIQVNGTQWGSGPASSGREQRIRTASTS